MVEELRNFKPDGYVCPCPMGHNTFEDCVDCEDSCFCELIACGDECVYNAGYDSFAGCFEPVEQEKGSETP